MYTPPAGYEDVIFAQGRMITPYLSVGMGIDTTAADDVTITGQFLPLSNPAQAIDAIYELNAGLAVFEGDGIPTPSARNMIAPPLSSTAYPPECGLWSLAISDNLKTIQWEVTLTFASVHVSALSLYFGEVYGVDFLVSYYKNNVAQETINVVNNTLKTWATNDVVEYDKIVINFTKASEINSHIRIAEVEFGASFALSNSDLAGEINLIYSHDPTGVSSYPNELDFSLLNINGRYDTDNPNNLYSVFSPSIPITLSFTASDGENSYTIPMGKYYIKDKKVSDTRLDITAYDSRALLQDIYPVVSLATTTSVGDFLNTLLTSYGIDHEIDTSLFSIYPEAAVDFTGDDDGLAIALYAALYAGAGIYSNRDGTLVVAPFPFDDYSVIAKSEELVYPHVDLFTRYNVVEVTKADNTTYQLDLRANGDVASVLAVSNPLISSTAKVTAVAAAIGSKLAKTCKTVKWRGDMTLDAGDYISPQTRYTASGQELLLVTEIEWKYNGMLKATITGVTL